VPEADVAPDADAVVADDGAGLEVVTVVIASFVLVCCSPADVVV